MNFAAASVTSILMVAVSVCVGRNMQWCEDAHLEFELCTQNIITWMPHDKYKREIIINEIRNGMANGHRVSMNEPVGSDVKEYFILIEMNNIDQPAHEPNTTTCDSLQCLNEN